MICCAAAVKHQDELFRLVLGEEIRWDVLYGPAQPAWQRAKPALMLFPITSPTIGTTGFKKQRVRFQDLFYDVVKAPGTPTTNGGENPAGVQIGNGVEVADTPRIFTQGRIEPTDIQTNIAIEGPGFFRVQLADGTEAYSRAGDFRPDSNGDLVTPEGFYLLPRINVPQDATQVSVATTGEVVANVNGNQQQLGQVLISNSATLPG